MPPRPSPAFWWTALAMALATFDLSQHLFNNWVGFDEGTLGLAATLVRGGAWPHHGFTDPYSGGLALLDAGAQAVFGNDLRALRIPFGFAAIGWVAVLAACFRRFVPPPAAAGLALVGFLWGPPLYTAAMPSWYLLFLATGVAWCLLRWHESGRPAWWGAAGMLIGLALFIKINALFVLAGAGCILLTHERHRWGIIGAVLLFAGVLSAVATVGRDWPWANSLTLSLPLLALAAAWAWRHHRAGTLLTTDLRPVLAPSAWLAVGVAAILLPWIAAYAMRGALDDLVQGVLVLPFRRGAWARLVPPGPAWPDLVVGGVMAAVLFGRTSEVTSRRVAAGVLVVAMLALQAAQLSPEPVVFVVWRMLRVGAVVALLAVAVTTLRAPEGRAGPGLIVGWIAAWFALLQYPFASPNYLAYVAPLILLAGTAVASAVTPRPVGAAVALSLALWTITVDHGQPLTTLGYTHQAPPPKLAPLDLPRGGLRVQEIGSRTYLGIVAVLDRWQARTIVAGPDLPEVYYLSDRPFQGREFFEFMGPEWSAGVLAARIEHVRPDAVVLNLRPEFSRVSIDSVIAALSRRPVADTIIGHFWLLRFSSAPPSGPSP